MKNKLANKWWLTWRLIRKQKLRTAAIFCGLLFSGFLLGAFESFGYEFWEQVHEGHGGSGDAVGYDQTQMILLALVTVLLLLVAGCCAVLLHNLYSLTFVRRWRSLKRLAALGASPCDLGVVTVLENVFFYGTSVPLGWTLSLAVGKMIGIRSRPPFFLVGGALLWIWMVCCLCSFHPLWVAQRRVPGKKKYHAKKYAKITHARTLRQTGSSRHPRPISFSGFMTGKYRRANRGHHVRIVLTILAAILLYVPASYLIETNIYVQRAELEAKYGIQYSCSPETKEELGQALAEYQRLADDFSAVYAFMPEETREQYTNGAYDDSSIVYVSMPASGSVQTEALSESLRNMLREMGWREEDSFSCDGTIYFLEDQAYAAFLETAGVSASASAVLIDRYINRRTWSEDAVLSYRELPLLNAGRDCSGVELFNETASLSPDAVAGQAPEGLNTGGDLSLVLPLSRLEDFLSPRTDYPGLYVCGKFQDLDEMSYCRLERSLGEDAPGSLRNTREILREWYASMSGVHKAMAAICSLLFAIAVLNMFSMMLFQYLERRQGLAILWSLGQSPWELLRILAGEHMRNLAAAIGLGIPISGLLCYYIYKIFCRVWQVEFVFPLEQTALIAGAACALSLLCFLVEGLLMRGQDFLRDIKETV